MPLQLALMREAKLVLSFQSVYVEISMTILLPSDLLEQQQWRYATKQFDPNKRIPDESLSTESCPALDFLEESALKSFCNTT